MKDEQKNHRGKLYLLQGRRSKERARKENSALLESKNWTRLPKGRLTSTLIPDKERPNFLLEIRKKKSLPLEEGKKPTGYTTFGANLVGNSVFSGEEKALSKTIQNKKFPLKKTPPEGKRPANLRGLSGGGPLGTGGGRLTSTLRER